MRKWERLVRVECVMHNFKPLTITDEFLDQVVFKYKSYLFYNKKTDWAYCTRCKAEHKASNIKNLKHNKYAVCPNCGVPQVCKAQGYVKNGFEDVVWSEHIEEVDGQLLFRYVRHIRKYDADGNYETYTWEQLREVMSTIERNLYEYQHNEGHWDIYHNTTPGWLETSVYKLPREVVLANDDFSVINESEDFKYSCIDIVSSALEIKHPHEHCFIDKHKLYGCFGWNKGGISNYLYTYSNNRWMEKLIKCGLYSLAIAMATNPHAHSLRNRINPEGNTIFEVLKVNRNELKMIKSCTSREDAALEYIQDLRRINLTQDQLTRLVYANGMYIECDSILELCRYMSNDKAIDWYLKHGSTYTDYISMADKLGWNMKSKSVLFPADLKKAHDEALSLFNEKQMENLKAKLHQLSKEYEFENNDLCIVVPQSGEDISREGKILHHCVGRYIERVAAGKTMILFVRRKNDINKPYYTMEWNHNRIIQCRGLKNCDPTDEVKEFIEAFREKMAS